MFAGKFVSLRPEVWARGKPFEVCLLSSFVHENKSKQNSNPFMVLDSHGLLFCTASAESLFPLELGVFRVASLPPACFRGRDVTHEQY